ncbi:hypothetical protein NHQ30_003483 [Ciborinia camelliae]|nr:hypothetical protein NHQ30_003483 [Ciborinia camelliae]
MLTEFLEITLRHLSDAESSFSRFILGRGSRKYFLGTGPFALRVGGFKLVIIRDPEHAMAVWKDTKALTFDYFIQKSFKGIGVPEKSLHPMFREHPGSFFRDQQNATSHFVRDNPKNKRYIDVQEDWIREQLAPGPRMNAMAETFLRYIGEMLQAPPSSPKILLHSDLKGEVVRLYNWCRYPLVEAGTKAFLGKEVFDLDANCVQHYMDWEETSWKVAHQHPVFLSRDMIKARQNLMETFAKYYALEPARRPNLSRLFKRMQSEQQKLGLKLNEAASISIIMLWG